MLQLFFELSVLGLKASIFPVQGIKFPMERRGKALLVENLARSKVSLYMSMSSFIFLPSVKFSVFKRATYFLASLSCLISLLKVGLLGGVLSLITSIGFSMDLPLSFY